MPTDNEIQSKILDEIRHERAYQDAKWGVQGHSVETWEEVLREEIGEVFRAYKSGNTVEMVSELIQAASVIVAWIEVTAQKLGLDTDEIQSRNWDEGEPVQQGQPITFTIDTEKYESVFTSLSVGHMLEMAGCNPAKDYYLMDVINGKTVGEKHEVHHRLRPNGRTFVSVYTGPTTN